MLTRKRSSLHDRFALQVRAPPGHCRATSAAAFNPLSCVIHDLTCPSTISVPTDAARTAPEDPDPFTLRWLTATYGIAANSSIWRGFRGPPSKPPGPARSTRDQRVASSIQL